MSDIGYLNNRVAAWEAGELPYISGIPAPIEVLVDDLIADRQRLMDELHNKRMDSMHLTVPKLQTWDSKDGRTHHATCYVDHLDCARGRIDRARAFIKASTDLGQLVYVLDVLEGKR